MILRMDDEKLKILRNKISIPLNVAVQLLKKNDGNVVLSEKEFHDSNIKKICLQAECGYQTAKENYEICHYDIKKAIERINQKPIVITTGKTTDSKIGFIIWPENAKGEFYKTTRRNDAFVPTEDFNLIVKEFLSVFPLRNPFNNMIEEEFDYTGHNFFDHKTIVLIVEKIKNIEKDDEKEKAFLTKIINWLNDKLTYAEYIMVYGNL